MSQFNVTTTGTVPVVTIDDLHLTLTHPQTIDLRNDLVDRFSWAEILESDDLQAAIDAGEVNATDINSDPIVEVTLDRLSRIGANVVEDQIVDGVTDIAPSQNAVFDALALKLDASAISPFGLTLVAAIDAPSARTVLGLGTAATANVGDFATAAQGALADTALQPGDNVSELVNDAGYVDAVAAAAAAPVQSVFGRTGAVVSVASDYDDSQIDFTYSPTNFTATNAFVDGALEGIDNALGALQPDGNDTVVIRGDAIPGVPPSGAEVPSPIIGDTATVFLTDGTVERWVYTGTWVLAYTLAPNEATNLGYIASPTDGTVTSSTGTDATIPLGDAVNAGLLAPAQFTKLGFITVTQPVDLDTIESQQNSLITLSGVAAGSNDLGTFTGTTIPDGSTVKAALQSLETTLEAATAGVYGTEFNIFQDLAVSTTTSTTFQPKISGNTSSLPAGDYKILVSYSWNHNATQNDFEARFLFDGAAVGQNGSGLIHKAEPKDSAGNFSGTGSSQQYTFTQAFYVTVTAGVKSVALDYRSDVNGVASSIWDASIEIIRVQ